jgi:cellulose synthase operon protein YhjQ
MCLLFSASGGVGKTSIMATLGRAFAGNNERVLLAEMHGLSLLPFSFGAQDSGESELQSFLMPGSDGGVDILNILKTAEHLPRSSGTGERIGTSAAPILLNAARRADRLIFDVGSVNADDLYALSRSNQFALMPIVPDLNCALEMTRMEEAIQDPRLNWRCEIPLYYVLNKFDSSVALHRDTRSYLQQKVGDRLLPSILRRSDAMPEALAEGMTVIDYCPEAGIAHDFLELADWLRRRTATDGSLFENVQADSDDDRDDHRAGNPDRNQS